jgi:multidrug resistance efflux pump
VSAWLFALLLIGAATAGGTYLARDRMRAATRIDLGRAVLTAAPIAVGSPDSAVVSSVSVRPQDAVQAGQAIATLTLTDPRNGKSATEILRAPASGTVVAVERPAGSVIRPGDPVATLYDPRTLTFEVAVPASTLHQLRLGMAVTITGSGVGTPIRATVHHVVPRMGADPQTSPDVLTVVLVPEQGVSVSRFVPGLPFRATVDTTTAEGAPAAVDTGR